MGSARCCVESKGAESGETISSGSKNWWACKRITNACRCEESLSWGRLRRYRSDQVQAFKDAWLYEALPPESRQRAAEKLHRTAQLDRPGQLAEAWLVESNCAVVARQTGRLPQNPPLKYTPQDPRAFVYAWLEDQGA